MPVEVFQLQPGNLSDAYAQAGQHDDDRQVPLAGHAVRIDGVLQSSDFADCEALRQAGPDPPGRQDPVSDPLPCPPVDRRPGEQAAEQRGRSVAEVRVARPLDPDQATRLAAALSRLQGREVRLNVAVDPNVLGGISVRIGSDVTDATVATRLEQARRVLVG